jgi:lysozyme
MQPDDMQPDDMQPAKMHPDKALELFIQAREAFSSVPYLDGGKVPTIGFGSTVYANGKKVTMRDKAITRAEAESLFSITLQDYYATVNKSVKVKMLQREFNAMVSLCYNIGCDAFAKSTLVKLMNAQSGLVADQFLRWNKDNGVVVKGLTNRRELERAMFLGE